MRTEQLEYVAAVARLGSFRRAADELHISQPALSETVRNLERELGVDIFERDRSGASLSADGQELLSHIAIVIDAVDGFRHAADAHHHASRMVRVATVNAGTIPVLTPAIAAFRAAHPTTQVEVVGAQEEQIHRGLRAGWFDLGLITTLVGDDPPPEFETTRLLGSRPVVCLRPDHPLARLPSIAVAQLRETTLIVMRAGYLMHRYLHRLLGDSRLQVAYSTDGAEMGKLMVAEGLGVTLLPEFSIAGDPLERGGFITCRPLDEVPAAEVELVLRRRRAASPGRSAQGMHRMLVAYGERYTARDQKIVLWPPSSPLSGMQPTGGADRGFCIGVVPHSPVSAVILPDLAASANAW